MFGSFEKYRLVYSHLRKTYWSSWWVRISYILALISRILKLIVLPLAISLIITNLSKQDYSNAFITVLFYAVFSLCLGIVTPLIKYLGMKGENKICRETTEKYMAKLITTDMAYFNSNLSGALTISTRNYLDGGVTLVRTIRNRYLNTILSIIFPLCVIFWFDYWLGSITLVLSLTQAAYLLWASHVIDPLRSLSRELYKSDTGKMADIISNIMAIKSTGQENRYIAETAARADQESLAFSKRYTKQSVQIAFREFLTVIILLILLWLTVLRMSSGSITITVAVLVITYTTTILAGIYALSDDIDEHDDLIDKIMPELEFMDRKNVINDPKKPVKINNIKGDIVFKDVSFAYNKAKSGQVVFDKFNLHVPHGQKLGVVGTSGAGKSTLTKLLLRFEDVNSGAVLVDGIDVRQALQTDLRGQIALVPQEPMLFHTSIKDNIVVPRPNASDAEIEKALKIAHAHSFVHKLPEGINSIVGERGVKLSGGQKQRIAIARAVLQNAPIMVLDEATSALDSESEQIIKQAFADILRGKTAIVTAHRLSTLSEMDRIIVIDKGKIIEDGTHEQLVQKNGKYAKLWRYQQRLSTNS